MTVAWTIVGGKAGAITSICYSLGFAIMNPLEKGFSLRYLQSIAFFTCAGIASSLLGVFGIICGYIYALTFPSVILTLVIGERRREH